MKAAAVAACIGASIAVFLYLCIDFGLRAGFAAADWRARRAQRKD